MRVAIVSDYFYPNLGGTIDSVELLAKGFGELGHDVDVYAPYYPASEFTRAKVPHHERELGSRVRIHRWLSIPWSAPLYRMAIPWPTHLWWYMRHRPDVIHIQTIFGYGLEALLCAKLLHIPLVMTNHLAMELHAAYMPPWVLRLLARYVRWMCNTSQFVSAPSSFALDELGGPITAPHAVITNPIDLSRFVSLPAPEIVQERRRWGVSGPLVVYAGRLVKEKSIDVLLHAMSEVLRRIPGATLLLAGHGDIQPQLEALSLDLGMAKSVRFVGTLNKPELARFLAAADVYVSMSISETQGLVRLQAMACGTPVVVARSAATPKEVEGMTLVAPGDASDCAQAIVELLADSELRRRKGEESRQSTNRYAVDVVARQWETIYKKVVGPL